MFGPKKRHVDFILPKNPEENKAPERTDDEINSISSDNLALGPAATEQDIQNYSGGSIPGSPSSYYNMVNGQDQKMPQTQNPEISSQTTQQDNGIFVPFIPDGPIEEPAINQNSPNPASYSSSQLIMLHRKIDELMDKIYLLERKIERLESEKNY